jgi:hypothetical protein
MPLYDDRFRERSRGKVHALLFEAVASASQRDSLSAEVVNRAGILASDMPHAVVDKLRAALRKD